MSRKIPPLNLEGLPVLYRQQIPESYRDEFGHMNVTWYTYLFSMTFGEFYNQIGISDDYFKANRRGSFALETHTRYLAEVHIGQHVAVRTRALGRSAKRLHFMHFMTIEDSGALAAIQEHIAAHIDMDVRRMTELPPEFAQKFDQLVAAHNRLGWEAPECGAMAP